MIPEFPFQMLTGDLYFDLFEQQFFLVWIWRCDLYADFNFTQFLKTFSLHLLFMHLKTEFQNSIKFD